MPFKTSFVVQTFDLRSAQLVAGAREAVPTESDALTKAKEMASRMPGTAALKIIADDDTGELVSATILATFGDVPSGS